MNRPAKIILPPGVIADIERSAARAAHLDGQIAGDASFLSTLSADELGRLRTIVKRVHMKHYALRHCTNREADRIIEALGPRVKAKLEAIEARAKDAGLEIEVDLSSDAGVTDMKSRDDKKRFGS